MLERVQKFLAGAGVASRRQAEQLMLDGRVTVNGAVVRELGAKVDPDKDAVKVDGKRVHGEPGAYVLLHKPKNTICTLDDPEQRTTVLELVRGVKARLFPVGRLDYDTTGALLLTNDGELANLLMHPRHRFSKTYLAKVKGVPSEEHLEKLRRGVNIEGVRTAPAEARLVAVKEKNSLVELVLREGRNRQVKRMFLEIGHPVLRLHRSAYAFLGLDGLEPGQWRRLEPGEVKRLRDSAARADSPGEGGGDFQPRLKRPIQDPSRQGAGRPRQARHGRPEEGRERSERPKDRPGAGRGRPADGQGQGQGQGRQPRERRPGGPGRPDRPGAGRGPAGERPRSAKPGRGRNAG